MQTSNNPEMNLTEDQKVQVLLHALNERADATAIIRDRVQNICLWMLGIFITAAGWLLQSTTEFTSGERIYFSIIVFLSVLIIRLFYLQDLEIGFKKQQQIKSIIEQTLGLCKKGVYTTDSIYPEEWIHAGTPKGKGNFFFHNYLLIYSGAFILILSIWFK